MLRYFHYGSDNEIEDRETAFHCPKCGFIEKKTVSLGAGGRVVYEENEEEE